MSNKNIPPAPTDDQPGFDNRLKTRFITKGHWNFEELSSNDVSLADLGPDVVDLGPPQPALGLFSPEELERVQKNFPYKK